MFSRCASFMTVAYMLFSASSAGGQGCSPPLLVVEQDGAVSAGSKAGLWTAVQTGLPLRIGFSIDFNDDGKPDLTHWADAGFITAFEGEVFTQLVEIREQVPRRGKAHVDLSTTPRRWTGSVGSNGFLEGAFDDNSRPTRLRVRAIWCIDPRVPRENMPSSLRRPTKSK